MGDITDLLSRARECDRGAMDELVQALYPELHRMAHARLAWNSTITPLDTTSMVHETYLRLRSAEEGLARSKGQPVREARMLVNRAAIELALGQSVQALATIESALPARANGALRVQVIETNANMTHGQALLAVGRAPEAIEPLRKAYGYWLAHEPKSEWAAEAEYWFAQAYLANGDVKRGRWMEAEAQRRLARSAFKPHRVLATRPSARPQ
jgi:tetratricopeptide (TPR) repeat protein